MTRRRLLWHLVPSYLVITLAALGALTYLSLQAGHRNYINQVIVTGGPVQPRVKPGVAIAIIRDCLAALAALHRQDIVHGDIKPSNVLVSDEGRVVLLDFGLVKALTMEQLTAAGTVAGSPSYIAPDCVARFDSIRLEQEGPDRVAVSGIRGGPAPEMFKVSMAYDDGWKAVAYHPFIGQHYDPTSNPFQHFDEDEWELYHVAEDFSESTNLAAEHPEKLEELIAVWFEEAKKKGIWNDGRAAQRFRRVRGDKPVKLLDALEERELPGLLGDLRGKRALDVGCGTGRRQRHLRRGAGARPCP